MIIIMLISFFMQLAKTEILFLFISFNSADGKKWMNSIITSQSNHLQTTIVCKSFLYSFPSNWQKITPNYSSPWKVEVNGEFKRNRCISIEYIWMKCRPINRCVRFPYSARPFFGHLIECILALSIRYKRIDLWTEPAYSGRNEAAACSRKINKAISL